ncbi:MAG: tetratricopeptide repeat protein [Planctomycetota bacterium]
MSGFRLLSLLFVGLLGLQSLAAQDFPGTGDLEQAFDKKLGATTLRDLDEVADLCQSALDKGLSEEGKTQAKELQISAWLEYAEQIEQAVFGPQRDRRWKIYRREALQRLEKAVEAKPDSLSGQLLIARLNALEGGDRAAAMKAVEKAIELSANDNDNLAKSLMVRAALAESAEARLNDLNQAVKVAPENLEAIRMRGMLFLQSQQPDKAMEDFKRWAELEPENADPLLLTVQVLSELDRLDEAISVLNQTIEKQPENARLLSLRARLFLDQSRGKSTDETKQLLDKAVSDADAALKLDPQDIDALIVRATILSDRKQAEDALKDINKVLELQPNLIRGLWIRSLIQASQENYAEAIKDVQLLADNAPENPAFKLQLAALLNASKEPRKAIEIYEQVLRVDPENSSALRGRGDAYLSLGDHKNAIKDYTEALAFEPEDDGILNNLAWVLATSPVDELRDGKKAVELATKACEVTEFSQPHILSTLASAYAEVGDFENAIKYCKDGLAKSDNPKQQESMTKELKSYEEKKPWRELESVEDEKKKENAADGGNASPESAKPADEGDGKKSDGEKSDGEKSDGGAGGNGSGI